MKNGRTPEGAKTENPRGYAALLTLCCLVTFSYYFGSYMRMPVVPLFARLHGADTVQVGLINGCYLLMGAVLSIPLGLLSDRLGRKLLISSGLLIASATSLLLYFSTSPAQMMAICLLSGIGLAAFAPTIMSFVADISPITHLGRAYGWYTMALYGGMSLGPAAGGALAEWLGFRPVFLVSSGATLLVLAAVPLFLPSTHHAVPRGVPRRKPAAISRELLRNGPLLSCWLVTLGSCFAMGTFVTFAPLHAQKRGIGVGEIGLLFMAQALVNAILRIPFGHLSDRLPRRSHLVTAGLTGFALSMAAFGYASRIFPLILAAAALGAGISAAFTAVGALISELVPADSRGMAMGGYNSCIYLGMMLGSVVMGGVIEQLGFEASFLLAALVILLTMGLFSFMMRNVPARA